MARRKQNLPSRANGTITRKVNVIDLQPEIFKDEDMEVCTANIDDRTSKLKCHQEECVSINRQNYGIEIYSPITAWDSYVDVADIILEDVTMLPAELKVNGEHLKVRLQLPRFGSRGVAGQYAVSAVDVKVEVLKQCDDQLDHHVLDTEGKEHFKVVVSGHLNGSDASVSALVYLFKAGYVTISPYLEAITSVASVDLEPSCRLRIGVTQRALDGCDGILDSAKHIWSRNMLKVMEWLRPDLHTCEAMYSISESLLEIVEFGVPKGETVWKGQESGNEAPCKEELPFDTSGLYNGLRPDQNGPGLDIELPQLVPKLRPYQSRAAYWMVKREKFLHAYGGSSKCSPSSTSCDGFKPMLNLEGIKWPFCVEVVSIDGKSKFYYNPFSGCVSRAPVEAFPDVQGGILADEMGLGKTVELLACILANPRRTSTSDQSSGNEAAEKAAKVLHGKLMKRKVERIDCPCGASEDDSFNGVWVQCDHCDAWQHASCVGFGIEQEYSQYLGQERLSQSLGRDQSTLKRTRKKKRRKIVGEMASLDEEERIDVKEEFTCGTCARLIGSVEVEGVSGATLIVCPTPILGQWQEEIDRHIKMGSLKVIIYEGVQRGSSDSENQTDEHVGSPKRVKIVSAHELATADIVLTTYDTLRADLSHDVEGNDEQERPMRFRKRYPVVPTPLTRLRWWRICLDEAQMVESNSARATEMALRLDAQIRWCVTGTPIQRGLDDLYGLIKFLGVQPFNDLFWFTKALKEPYKKKVPEAMYFTHAYLKKIMWRSSKAQVSHELGLPEQEEFLTWLKFSPIEAHFYWRQHDRCARKAMEVMSKSSRSNENQEISRDRVLTHAEAAKVLNPLLSLRQACCHPQIGSSGLRSLQKSPMNMQEVLEVLIEKAKTEGEDAQRNLLGALNGMAALAILEEDIPIAIATYREALSLADENAEDFRVDPLQKLHVLHNLCEALRMHKACKGESFFEFNVPRTLRDGLLEQQCQEISTRYMSSFYSKLSTARQDYKNTHDQVCTYLKELQDMQGTTWWLDALASPQEGTKLVKKIKDSLLQMDENASSLTLRFDDINGLKYVLNREVDAIHHHREKLILRLSEINEMMDSPNPQNVEQAVQCSICDERQKGPPCAHCELDKLFQIYENKLFLLKTSAAASSEDAFITQQRMLSRKRVSTLKTAAGSSENLESDWGRDKTKRQASGSAMVSRSPSETETILRIIKAHMKQRLGQDAVDASKKHLEAMEAMRKEFAQARMLAVSQRMVLLALDELNMATTRLCFKYPGEDTSNVIDELFKLHPEEIPQRNARLTGEKFAACEDLHRAKGQLRYLKGLAIARDSAREIKKDEVQNTSSEIDHCEASMQGGVNNNSDIKSAGLGSSDDENCPVCHESLGMQMMVLPCGHMLCCKCMMGIAEQACGSVSEPELERIMCPSCRYRTHLGNIAFIDNGSDSNSYSQTFNRLGNKKEDAESSMVVRGSYGTKMEAVTKRLLRIQLEDPNAKFLIFSTWNDVLDVVEHTLSANNIRYVRAKGRRSFDAAIRKFKGQDVRDQSEKDQGMDKSAQALLLLVQQGANGLNLIEAQHVILIEPLLNPGAEAQAINRVHRIGQCHATYVHKFLIKNTVEESIYKLSQVKATTKNTTSVGRNGSNREVLTLTINDLNMLFKTETYECNQHEHETVLEEKEMVLPNTSLRNLPPAAAAAAAAEARLQQAQKNGQER